MKINQFFTDTLGAQLKNPRWSWGANDPLNHRVFLRVWQEGLQSLQGIECVHIATDVARRKSPGFSERHNHISLIRNEAEGYGVLCTAVDSESKEARKIKSFDDQTLVKFGELIKDGGDTFATIVARVPVKELARSKTSESTLTDDLQAIMRQKIGATMKESLVNSRVGQGLFRKQVLATWNSACAVTGSVVPDAIRASHIKPWRNSTNEERLDSSNGIPLVASLDALFDAGLISFTNAGELLISARLNSTEQALFDLCGKRLRKMPSTKALTFLEFHRVNVFRK